MMEITFDLLDEHLQNKCEGEKCSTDSTLPCFYICEAFLLPFGYFCSPMACHGTCLRILQVVIFLPAALPHSHIDTPFYKVMMILFFL